MLLSIQSLMAVGITLGIALVWTAAIAVAGVLWERHEIREFMTSNSVTVPAQESAQADDARELVLR